MFGFTPGNGGDFAAERIGVVGEVWKCEAPGGIFKALRIMELAGETTRAPGLRKVKSALLIAAIVLPTVVIVIAVIKSAPASRVGHDHLSPQQ